MAKIWSPIRTARGRRECGWRTSASSNRPFGRDQPVEPAAYAWQVRQEVHDQHSTLVALGGADAQVRGHVTGNLRVGKARGRPTRWASATQSRVAKSAFPTDLVYSPIPGPELRLVTCGGAFDRTAGSYVDNIIVDALPTDAAGLDHRLTRAGRAQSRPIDAGGSIGDGVSGSSASRSRAAARRSTRRSLSRVI